MQWGPVAEALVLLGGTFALAYGLGISTLWLVIPTLWLTFTNRSLAAYGIGRGVPQGIGFHVVVSIAIFVPYLIGHALLASMFWGARFQPTMPEDMGWAVLQHVFLIALPEEVFFRGYLQTQIDRASTRRWRVLGAEVGVGWVASSVLFGACHIFNGGPARLVTAFPGLWYGWLRARTGNVWVPALYHAASNLLMKFMVASLQP